MSREEQFDFYWKEIFNGLPYNPIEFNVYRFDQSMSLPSKVNKLYDTFKQLALNNQEVMDYLKEFVETFDFKLEHIALDVLTQFYKDGKLAEIVTQVIDIIETFQNEMNEKIDLYQAETNNKYTDLKQEHITTNQRLDDILLYLNNFKSTMDNYILNNNQDIDQLEKDLIALNTKFTSELNNFRNLLNNLPSLGIVDSVQNLAELNSKYPLGTNGMVYVKDKDKWYVYNNGWQEGGSLNSLTSVSLDNLTFVKSLNLYNKNSSVIDKYVSYSNGLSYANADYNMTDFIPVKSGSTYFFSRVQQVAFYTGSNEASYVSGIASTRRFIVPNGVKYLRTNLVKKDVDKFYVGLYQSHIYKYAEKIPSSVLDEKTQLLLLSFEQNAKKSKNIFNKSNIQDGVYVDFATGVLDNNPQFVVTDYIMLEPNTTYYKNDDQQCAFYYANDTDSYVSGMQSGNFFTTDNDIMFVRITIPKNKLSSFILAKSSVPVGFEPYGYIFDNSLENTSLNVTNPNDNFSQKISSLEPNETIFLASGEYNSQLNLKNFYGNVVGLVGEKVVLSNTNNDYDYPPLILSGGGTFENITFHAKGSSLPEKPPYALHFDYSGSGKTIFKNCTFISDYGQGVGIGMHDNQELIFINCKFYGYANGFYAHCNVDSQTKNQKLIVKDCYFYSELESAIRIDDSNQIFGDKTGTTMIVEFINCLLDQKNKNLPLVNAYNSPITGISGNVKLSEKSCGNNVVVLNNNVLLIDKMLQDYQNGLLG